MDSAESSLTALIDETVLRLGKVDVLRSKAETLANYLTEVRLRLKKEQAKTIANTSRDQVDRGHGHHHIDEVVVEQILQGILASVQRIESLGGPSGLVIAFVLSRMQASALDEWHKDLVVQLEPQDARGGSSSSSSSRVDEALERATAAQERDNAIDFDADLLEFRRQLRSGELLHLHQI